MESRPHPEDSRQVELLGRNRLIDELLRDNLEVALPVRDRGIDLIAYADRDDRVTEYRACPIQLKAAWKQTFGVDQKYERFPGLLIVYVWNLGSDTGDAVTYAMNYQQCCKIADTMGWNRTRSWWRHVHADKRAGKRFLELLEPFRMKPGSWWKLIVTGPTV